MYIFLHKSKEKSWRTGQAAFPAKLWAPSCMYESNMWFGYSWQDCLLSFFNHIQPLLQGWFKPLKLCGISPCWGVLYVPRISRYTVEPHFFSPCGAVWILDLSFRFFVLTTLTLLSLLQLFCHLSSAFVMLLSRVECYSPLKAPIFEIKYLVKTQNWLCHFKE